MKILAIIIILGFILIAYSMYTAPMMDDNGRITKPGKKLKDLFRRK